MTTDKKYMKCCLELAKLGTGNTAPNPMVGSVIVYNGEIIGEGFHQKYGEAHAEVNAINSVANPELLRESTIYVTLEPCSHFGLTPPCSDLIIKTQIPRVVIGTIDPFAKVAGKGIEKLKKAGIKVAVGILEDECRELNKRFFTFYEKKRPYIILKWAQTIDGFIDIERAENEYGEPTWITGKKALLKVHKMRAIEAAIIVGTNTAQKDNPSLTVRHCEGENPVRMVLDNKLRLPKNLNLFDKTVKTIVFNSIQNCESENISFLKIDFNKKIIPQILAVLYQLKLQSLIVEGGKQLLESFIESGMWDEAFVFTGNKYFYKGVRAPKTSEKKDSTELIETDELTIFKNKS